MTGSYCSSVSNEDHPVFPSPTSLLSDDLGTVLSIHIQILVCMQPGFRVVPSFDSVQPTGLVGSLRYQNPQIQVGKWS